ncbi:hypothetical protein PNOK_0852200 [Pyrrhoderma noxium]|uniref:Uncharacterized protein n=1 Tax=Pyrrhoderma noxium TaxID=2282107 RepID=A0A286U828_9AGAM|nr:hypothetical protein PNOK_0852200 [Pyrrhoderma noxium]
MDTPVLCWCCTINPNILDEEYNACYNAVMEAWPGNPFTERLKEMPRNYDTLREMITYLIPLLMMRQQRIPRTKWKLHQTDRGKKWIEKTVDSGSHPMKQLTTMTGFTTAYDYNLVVLAACQGKRNQVVNIGLGVKRLSSDGVPVQHWAQSQQHKLTQREIQMLTGLQDDVLLSRLIILLTIKESLMNGLGQPVGFDLSRIECNPVEEWMTVDGQPLIGWEFRLFRCQGEALVNEQQFIDQYQMCVAYFRGNNVAKFIFVEKPGDIERLTQYFPFDRLVDVIPRLLQESKTI